MKHAASIRVLASLLCTVMCVLLSAFPSRLAAATEADNGRAENLLVFVGQKIDLAKQPPPRCDDCIIMDEHYIATYRILETVYGHYRGNTIAFDVYDHYGRPAFADYDTVLLFVSRRPDGSWEHEKYQFVDLYKGVDGEWYGCGDPYRAYPNAPRTVHARPVVFPAPVSYPLKDLTPQQVRHHFPAGYFKIRHGRAYCQLGTPVAGLFEAKRQTVLAARGFFR